MLQKNIWFNCEDEFQNGRTSDTGKAHCLAMTHQLVRYGNSLYFSSCDHPFMHMFFRLLGGLISAFDVCFLKEKKFVPEAQGF